MIKAQVENVISMLEKYIDVAQKQERVLMKQRKQQKRLSEK
jgi:hypothetical protein